MLEKIGVLPEKLLLNDASGIRHVVGAKTLLPQTQSTQDGTLLFFVTL